MLALLEEGEGVGSTVLSGIGLTGERLTSRFAPSRRAEAPGPATTWGLRSTLQLASAEASQLGHDVIGTGHLLLGVSQNTEAWGVRMLRDLGVDLQALRAAVLAELGKPGAAKGERLRRARKQAG